MKKLKERAKSAKASQEAWNSFKTTIVQTQKDNIINKERYKQAKVSANL